MIEEPLNEINDSKEDNNNEDSDKESNANDILKYVLALLALLFKIFAFMHINLHNPSDQSNPPDSNSTVSKTVDTPANEISDTPISESVHAFFYSHTGWGHVVIDMAIYLFLAVLFVMVFHKLMCLLSTWGKPFYCRLFSRIKQLILRKKWVYILLICAVILLICAVIFL